MINDELNKMIMAAMKGGEKAKAVNNRNIWKSFSEMN